MADPAQSSSDTTIQLHGEEFWHLSGKPFFYVIIGKSHRKPGYRMVIPTKLHPILPACSIPTILTLAGKSWKMTCAGKNKTQKYLDAKSWAAFVVDKILKIGDGCVFEVLECSSCKLALRVQILRGDIPAELSEKEKAEEAEKPIVL